MPNILVFHQFYTRLDEPGIARFNLFADSWKEENFFITVIAGMINYQSGKKKEKYKNKFFVKEKDGEVSVIRVFDSALGYRTFFGRVLSYLSFLIFSFFAGIFLKRPDVIIVSSPPIFLGIVGYLISVIKRTPFVLEIRDLWPDEVIELGYVKNKILIKLSYVIEKFIYKKTRIIIVNSPGFKEFLIERKNINEDKISVIPNPAKIENKIFNKEELQKKLGWQNKFVILYSGSHSFVYDFDTIIDVARDLQGKSDILFVFIGDGRQKPRLIGRVEKDKIDNVKFLDPVSKDKIGEFFAACDVGVVPLKNMGLLKYVYATKIFDYFAAKKPVIILMEGVSADLVCQSAKAGICLKSGDVLMAKEAILEFYNQRNLAEEAGERGFNFIKNNFSADILAKKYLESLKPIIIPKR